MAKEIIDFKPGFYPAEKTLDFSGMDGFDIRKLYAVIHCPSNIIIYGKAISGYTALLSGNIISLVYDTTNMGEFDDLTILYEI